jgi:organic radical activating enzyme
MGIENKIFCTAPFTTLRIESYNQGSSEMHRDLGVVFKPGCIYNPKNKISSLDQYLHGEEMTWHRDNLCNGSIPHKSCDGCSNPEKIGLQSIRLDLLKKPWASDQLKIRMLDIQYSNICNLGCLFCGPEQSSYSSDERFKAGITDKRVELKNNLDIALDAMNQLPDLDSVSFLGGEFFIFKDNSVILDQIIERKLAAKISTNASILEENLLSTLEKIPRLEIQISMDGVAEMYEFMRYPAKWDTFITNVGILLKRLPWADNHFNIVIQPLNIQNLHEIFEHNNRFVIQTHHQILNNPPHLTWSILTPDECEKMIFLLKNKQQKKYFITSKQKSLIDDVIQSLAKVDYSPESRRNGIEFLAKLWKYRRADAQYIKKMLGELDVLADQIVNAMTQKTLIQVKNRV